MNEVLRQQTKIGLTFGEILSLAVVIGSMFYFILTMNVKISENTARIVALENSRSEERQLIEINRTENSNAHIKIVDKLDLILIRSNNAEFVK